MITRTPRRLLERRPLAASASTRSDPAKPILYVLPHSHFDTEWEKNLTEYLSLHSRFLAERLDLLRKDKRHVFLLDEEAVIGEFVRRHPNRADELREAIERGHAEPKGMVVQADVGLCLGETTVRQFAFGKFLIERLLGFEPGELNIVTAHNIDNYTLIAQYPQILAKCGRRFLVIGSYATTVYRARPKTAKQPFRWRGPDGSKVLVHLAKGYDGIGDCPQRKMATARAREIMRGARNGVAFAYSGHDCTAPDPHLLEKLEEWSGRDGFPSVRLALSHEYFAPFENDPALPTIQLEAWTDHDGCYECRSDFRSLQRRVENLATDAETVCLIAARLGQAYPEEELEAAWYDLLLSTHHDPQLTALPDPLLRDVETRLKRCEDQLRSTIERTLHPLAPKRGWLIVNTLPWPRSDLVDTGAGEILVEDVPAVGFKAVEILTPVSSSRSDWKLETDVRGLLALKRRGKTLLTHGSRWRIAELIATADHGCASVIRDKGISLEEWHDDLPSIETLPGSGPRVTLRRRFRESYVVQEFIAHRQLSRIDIRVVVDWRDVGVRLRMAVPQAESRSRFYVHEPFAIVPREHAGPARPISYWGAFMGTRHSVALLNRTGNVCRSEAGYLMQTLLRSADMDRVQRSPESPSRDKDCGWCMIDKPNELAKELGRHEYHFSLLAGPLSFGEIHRAAYEFNHPLILIKGGTAREVGEKSFLSVTGAFVSAFKQRLHDNDMTLRLYNPLPEKITAKVAIGEDRWRVTETDMNESPVGDEEEVRGEWQRTLAPYDIVTLKIRVP